MNISERLFRKDVSRKLLTSLCFKDSLTEFTGHQLNHKKNHSQMLRCSGKNEKQANFNLKIIFKKL